MNENSIRYLHQTRSGFWDFTPQIFLDQNRPALKWRWPAIWDKLRSWPESVSFQVVSRPQKTLIVNGIHLTSSYNKDGEAETLASKLEWADCEEITIYGIGLGDLQRVLLSSDKLKKLNVVIMSPEIEWLLLKFFDHSDWLNDKRVALVDGAASQILKTPYVFYPYVIKFSPDAYLATSQEIVLETTAPAHGAYHAARRSFYKQRISAATQYVEQDRDVKELEGTAKGKTVVVCGGGPTLSEFYPWIKAHRDFTLITVSTALLSLQNQGIIPDIVTVLDPNDDMLNHFDPSKSMQLQDRTLVYVPIVHQKIIEDWPGKRYVAYIPEPALDEINARFPRGILFANGTVMHMTVDLAVIMGAKTIIVLGFDCGYPGNQSHVEDSIQAKKTTSFQRHQLLNGYGERINTDINLVGYLRDMEQYIGLNHHVSWIKGGKAGAVMRGAKWLEDTDAYR